MSAPAPGEALLEAVRAAKSASRALALLGTAERRSALHRMAGGIEAHREAILAANADDVREADREVAAGRMSPALLDRLKLDAKKLSVLAGGVRAVASLPDPVGRVTLRTKLDDGLVLERVTSPLGVLAVIFESRPDAVPQIASLALASANALILKGGREAARSTAALVAAIEAGLGDGPVPPGWLVRLTDRSEIDALLGLDGLVDLVIPRGSSELVRSIRERSRIPVLGHSEGVCHVFLDAAADPAMAAAIAVDAKVQYPAACNAAETLLVHAAAAEALLGAVLPALAAAGVELRGCEATRRIAAAVAPSVPLAAATDADWRAEYGAPILAVRVVASLDEALAHIARHGSSHTETIVTADPAAAERFLAAVDSAGVFWNASTRFADGFRYGFGAEVGISTDKLHARGPVGLDGLVTYRYLLRGEGQVVADYASGKRRFVHEPLG